MAARGRSRDGAAEQCALALGRPPTRSAKRMRWARHVVELGPSHVRANRVFRRNRVTAPSGCRNQARSLSIAPSLAGAGFALATLASAQAVRAPRTRKLWDAREKDRLRRIIGGHSLRPSARAPSVAREGRRHAHVAHAVRSTIGAVKPFRWETARASPGDPPR